MLLLNSHGAGVQWIQIDVHMADRALGKGVRVTESVGKRINKPTGKLEEFRRRQQCHCQGYNSFRLSGVKSRLHHLLM